MFGRWKKRDPRDSLSEENRSKEEWKVEGDDGEAALLTIAVIIFFSIVFLVVMGSITSFQIGHLEEDTTLAKSDEEVSTMAEVTYREKGITGNENQNMENEQDWISRVFGNSNPVSVTGKITIAGLSEKEKSELNFIESDFVKDIGAFLNKQGIMTSLVYFEEKTECSADQAHSYVASMAGISDQNLQVIFYPDIPGEYIFLLTDKQKLVIKISNGAMFNQNNSSQNRQQHVQSTPQIQPIQNNQVQENQSEENSYNASVLSVYSVSEELQNYLGNQYLLQYALYDYLYQKGYYNVKSATVVSYSIDGDSRSASMLFVLDNGKSVNAVYSLDNRNYQFS